MIAKLLYKYVTFVEVIHVYNIKFINTKIVCNQSSLVFLPSHQLASRNKQKLDVFVTF